MTSYILKNIKKEMDILLLEEKESFSITPKKSYKWVKKITILDSNMLSKALEKKINHEYEKLLKLVYSFIANDDTTSGDVLTAYTEIERIKNYLISLIDKGLKKKTAEKYLQKLYVLEHELKKVHVLELTEEIEKVKCR